ncbi:uncharacterized protein BBA_10342 [Beauveria bassiana ARSEF 2860]|uniref:Uncharacterized protein n=1 Tax=Beauveria bassiana (strain ARSEF 2860) TaxID=655819 RepID=J5J9A2_BEAB2|nr:uncharacterized protein BBA_10342 [Beauveria bassiana ARSEF 2860]EJP60711.1 hypothetical protein BBA_10342 [Beauveria bassiana ARSEF 2860]
MQFAHTIISLLAGAVVAADKVCPNFKYSRPSCCVLDGATRRYSCKFRELMSSTSFIVPDDMAQFKELCNDMGKDPKCCFTSGRLGPSCIDPTDA